MARSKATIFLIRTGAVALVGFAVLASGSYLRSVTRVDPFASLKKTPAEPTLGVRLNNVQMVSYKGEKLVTKASMKRLDVRKDSQVFELHGITNGMYMSDKGQVQYAAPNATWDARTHLLQANNARVKNKDLDVTAPTFTYNSGTAKLTIPGPVVGKVKGGDINAMQLTYDVRTGEARGGQTQWKGKLALNFQEPTVARPWRLEGESWSKKDGQSRYTKGYGTDGEIIVMADLILHDDKTDLVTATGNVKYFSAKANLICEKAVIERKIKKATLTGKVQMLMKPRDKQVLSTSDEGIPPYRPILPEELQKNHEQANTSGQTEEQKKVIEEIRSAKNVRNYPTVCYADEIEYWYKKGERRAILKGNPQARQDLPNGGWRQIWTNQGFYDGEKETLRLVSSEGKVDTRMINSVGDDLTASWFLTSTKEDDDEMSGKDVKGYVADYSDELPRDNKGGSTGGSVGKPPPPPKNRTSAGLNGKIGGKGK